MANKMVASVLIYKLRSPRFKAENKDKEDGLSLFKPGLLRTGFFRCGKECYHFKQELMVGIMVV